MIDQWNERPDPTRLFIFAGEPSGDLHGSRLARHLKKISPAIHIEGVAGPKMRLEEIQGPLTMEDFEVMGFSDVIRALPRLYSHFQCILKTILSTSPHAVVLIDYPGFNLRLAKALRKKGFQGKIIQYISPSVWAWGKHRIAEMEKTLDLLLTIYPFEAAHFSKTALQTHFIGSPIQEYISQYSYDNEWQQQLQIPNGSKLIALFPGSRKGEIARNLPFILEAAAMLKQNDPSVIFGISCFNEATNDYLNQHLERFPILGKAFYRIPKNFTYELMRKSTCAIAKSGTITLELALHKCPTVVIYKLSLMNRLYAQYILKVNLPHYCIVNILAQKEVFPELIKNGLNKNNLFEQVKSLATDGPKRQACLQACKEIDKSLGTNDANTKAAESIMRMIQC
jgi:lipid-A-disaccharide synthase